MARALSTNNYGPAKFIVDSSAANGTNTTIASALTAASSGDTIFIRPGTYTENLTLKAGVNLATFESDASLNGTGNVIISGTCTLTAAGSVTISGIQLQTNSASLLAVTGSAASIVNLNNCYLNILNSDGITFSSSSSSAKINMLDCSGNVGTTGIKIFNHSSAGDIFFQNCFITNTGASTTSSTISAGSITLFYSTFLSPITSSGTSTVSISYSGMSTGAQNVTCITCGGSGAHQFNATSFSSGTATAISISNTTGLSQVYISSTNTNAISGAGAVIYNGLIFNNTSQKISTTTQTGGTLKGGQTQAPSAGFLGEQLSATATAVATTNSTPKTITSVSVTAGIWDISGSFGSQPTGGIGLMSGVAAGISTTDNTLGATLGINYMQLSVAAISTSSFAVPIVRATLTATTTYYLVVNNVYSSTTCPTNAMITATRVG